MNPVLVQLGPITLYWYTIMILIGFLLGGALAFHEAKKYNISEEFMTNLFFYLIPISIIGARLYYVLFNLDYYLANPINIFKIWEGGLAIHGGLLFGFIFLYIYSKKNKVNWIRLLDILVVSVAIGQAIGRWGNFFNGEAHGAITSLETLKSWHLPQFIIDGMYIGGFYYVPTFLIESIWCFILFIILLIIRKIKNIKIGQISCLYLILYGFERFFVESMRTDSLMLLNFKVAQIVSIIMILIGIICLIKIGFSSSSNKYNDRGI